MPTHPDPRHRRTQNFLAHSAIDAAAALGATALGTAAGRATYLRLRPTTSPGVRFTSAVLAGVATALPTEELLSAAASPLRHRIGPRTSHRRAPATRSADVRADVAASVAHDAAFHAACYWSFGERDGNAMKAEELWRGFEDGTAVYFLKPGWYLHYRPDRDAVGTRRSGKWTRQYRLVSGAGTSIVEFPAHLLELLDHPEHHPQEPEGAERTATLQRLVEQLCAEQPEVDHAQLAQLLQKQATADDITVDASECHDLLFRFGGTTTRPAAGGGADLAPIDRLAEQVRLERPDASDVKLAKHLRAEAAAASLHLGVAAALEAVRRTDPGADV